MSSAAINDENRFAWTGDSIDRFFRVHLAHSVENGAKWRAQKSQFRERNHGDLGCPDLRTKIFSFRKIRNRGSLPPSRPDTRGVRVVTNVERDAMDADGVARRAIPMRTAKSCGPD